MPIKETWLQQVLEEAIDPDLPIIDAHHHLWFVAPAPVLRSYDYLEGDYVRDATSGHNIIASVYVECRNVLRTSAPEHLWPASETAWVNEIAERRTRETRGAPVVASAIVGFADLTMGEQVEEVLRAHLAAAPARFRGVRQISNSSDSPAVVGRSQTSPAHRLLDPAFRRGFARLAQHDLSFDAWLYHPQLPELIDLARAFPETRIVLDHLGAPLGAGSYADRRREAFDEWRSSIRELARCDNVFMKLGGSGMHMFGFGWEHRALPPTSDQLVAATRDYYLTAIDAFSPSRCMFESNFPVEKERCSAAVLWNSFKKIVAEFSLDERADLFMNTAAQVYRLSGLQNVARSHSCARHWAQEHGG